MDLQAIRSVIKLVLAGLFVGAALTAVADLVSGHRGDASAWLGSVATVGALVVAIGIYAVQRHDQDLARQELLDRLDAQDELLNDLAQKEPAELGDDALTEEQRRAVEKMYGPDSIAATWPTGAGASDEPALVRLQDGRVATVYSTGRAGRTVVRPLGRHAGRMQAEGADRRARRRRAGSSDDR